MYALPWRLGFSETVDFLQGQRVNRPIGGSRDSIRGKRSELEGGPEGKGFREFHSPQENSEIEKLNLTPGGKRGSYCSAQILAVGRDVFIR